MLARVSISSPRVAATDGAGGEPPSRFVWLRHPLQGHRKDVFLRLGRLLALLAPAQSFRADLSRQQGDREQVGFTYPKRWALNEAPPWTSNYLCNIAGTRAIYSPSARPKTRREEPLSRLKKTGDSRVALHTMCPRTVVSNVCTTQSAFPRTLRRHISPPPGSPLITYSL